MRNHEGYRYFPALKRVASHFGRLKIELQGVVGSLCKGGQGRGQGRGQGGYRTQGMQAQFRGARVLTAGHPGDESWGSFPHRGRPTWPLFFVWDQFWARSARIEVVVHTGGAAFRKWFLRVSKPELILSQS